MSQSGKQDTSRTPRKIHLVGPSESVEPAKSEPKGGANNRIEIGEYVADILIDRRSSPSIVHWIVQRRGSPEILQWGHEDTFDAASQEAVSWIESLKRYDEFREQVNR